MINNQNTKSISCVGGDFNMVEFLRDCSSGCRLSSAMRRFSKVIEDLRDLPLQGFCFFFVFCFLLLLFFFLFYLFFFNVEG